MDTRFDNPNIYYPGNYVINSLDVASESDILSREQQHNILFVGNSYYKWGAERLIEALLLLKINYPTAELHIVGMDASNFKKLPEYVKCYGFLDKGNESDKEKFHNLFKSARVFVNTNPKWGAFSTTIEAMYSYIPIIVSPYDEIVSTFGEKIDFGCYCSENEPENIAEKIQMIFDSPDYHELCINAHNAVKDFTWSSYIDKLLKQIESI
jgi:glycosyltransferase involved in cell wall biosynthesis